MISYKYLSRYREIATVLMKYGFGYIVEKLNKESFGSNIKIHISDRDTKSMTVGERMRYAFEELGPTYIKIGQILSTRKDIFDDDTIKELSLLRKDTVFTENEVCMSILKKELGCDLEDVFMFIDDTPVASASIGQVYSAKLIDGDEVIIKIQKPGIDEIIKADLYIIKKLCGSLSNLKKEFNLDILDIVSEIEVQLLRELDYKFEAINGIKLRSIFEDSYDVYIPKIYDEYTTSKVLIMEKVKGKTLSEVDMDTFNEDEKKKISEIGVKAFFKQVMKNGFFHADPHPGNIFIVGDYDDEEGDIFTCCSGENRDIVIAFVDFGMIGLIDDKSLKFLNQLISAAASRDIDKIIRILKDMDVISSDINEKTLKRDLLYSMHYYYDTKIYKIGISDVLNEVFRFMRSHKIVLPPQYVILAKTVMILEGTSRSIYSDFSIENIAMSYVKYYREDKLNIKKDLMRVKSDLDEYYYDLINIQYKVKNILDILEKNEIKIDIGEMKSPGLEDSIKKFTTQLSISIMLAASIVGSSLIMASDNIKSNQMIKIVSIVGFIISFIIGITLVFLILRNNYQNRKHK